jgi:DNA-binding protein HU-beta|uniref:HU family DNA-binding protein n=1 Tax=candidate division WOR-3 bacterium TaxID=2052148 RepID=A0A7C3UYU0_UNCW3
MKKAELIEKIAKDAGISKKQAGLALQSFMDAVKMVMKKEDELTLPKFGRFYVKKTKARIGRNPKTGEEIKIPAKKRPAFRAGKELKLALK